MSEITPIYRFIETTAKESEFLMKLPAESYRETLVKLLKSQRTISDARTLPIYKN